MAHTEIAALTAAVLWTCSSMLWGRLKLSAITINACKNAIGCVFITGHLLVAGCWLLVGLRATPTSRPAQLPGHG